MQYSNFHLFIFSFFVLYVCVCGNESNLIGLDFQGIFQVQILYKINGPHVG